MKTPSDPKLLLKQNPRKGADMAALLLGAGIGYAINLSLPLLADVTISCIFLILLSRLRNRLKTPAQWWGSIGLCSGSFLGTASSMVYVMQRAGEAGSAYSPWERLALIVILGITGVLAGRYVGIDPDAVEGRSIGDLLRSLSGTFTGVFGVLVAIAFVFNGLEEARTLSSRLTTTLTIIILGLVGPGWISHRLKNYQRNQPH
ncbi:hypothetical protein MITS9509_01488 [Synechococcus sp. MIT S9509]|uniref:hypothetical protein n=1 Tax=unclassified Synechococcus TaxID=2626047 RepID=UPI0007BBA89B|nr:MULTISPECIES: hypothetical protein [unclassified Synechococcus]KZR86562.1 hypothetical protein MITS9504_01163 [Synechococcus sp. MIT S9504]KZR92497.1 hypothetical protein MITS9509_01488 [Synechococcus sp. MIT S9509]